MSIQRRFSPREECGIFGVGIYPGLFPDGKGRFAVDVRVDSCHDFEQRRFTGPFFHRTTWKRGSFRKYNEVS